MTGVYLFAVFDLNDYNYLKMPWRIIMEIIPPLSFMMPKSNFYILTDTKPVFKVKEILEKNSNVKVISLNAHVLRYPYRGLLQAIKVLKKQLNIETLVVFTGINLFMWIKIAKLLSFKVLVLVFLTPIYTMEELALITAKSIPRLFRYGTFSDFLDFVKLQYENVFVRLILLLSRKAELLGEQRTHLIVMHDNAFNLFTKLHLRVYKAVPKLIHVKKKPKQTYFRANKMPRIAYFGPLILARGYDIVVELSGNIPYTITLFSRTEFTHDFSRKFSRSNLNIIKKLFNSFEDIVQVSENYDLILLPFRFVLSDIPLVVLELACSGSLVVTTPYSHISKFSGNLLLLDINQLEDTDKIIKLADFANRIPNKYFHTISWEELVNLLDRILRSEE